MDVDKALGVIEQVLLPKQLSPTEQFVLRQSWYGRKYEEMAQECGYGSVYIKEIGSKLWHDLSQVLGKRVTKKNLHLLIQDYCQNGTDESEAGIEQTSSNCQAENHAQILVSITKIELPGDPLPLNSPLYVNRPPLEELTYSEISQPGSVISIKAPTKMGKTSLLNRVIAYAKDQGYKTVCLDLREADSSIVISLNKFLRWFCFNISRQLNLTPKVDDYWDDDMGSKISCKLYFEEYLLHQTHTPLLLAVNELNWVFQYPNIAHDFLSMLRSWHEQAKQVEIWQKLRLILAHTTEIYVPLKLNQSPFNVGRSIRLPPFSLEQAQELAKRYGLDWATGEEGAQRLAPLVEMVGGHPFLTSVALYHLYQQTTTLEKLLQSAPTQTGIYGDHLRSLLASFRDEAELASALRQVVTAQDAVQLEANTAHKLESLGIIKLDGNQAKPSCELYRLYFLYHLRVKGLDTQLIQSEKNQECQYLGNINTGRKEQHSQFATWHYLKEYSLNNWQQWTKEMTALSLILGEIDYFKFYADAYGQLAGDNCIQQIASTIYDCVRHQAILIAQIEGIKFAALLPHTDAIVAAEIADFSRQQVKALGISHDQSKVGGFPSQFVTLSIGVASTTPNLRSSPEMLIAAAEEALLQSKRKGRDRVTLAKIPLTSLSQPVV